MNLPFCALILYYIERCALHNPKLRAALDAKILDIARQREETKAFLLRNS